MRRAGLFIAILVVVSVVFAFATRVSREPDGVAETQRASGETSGTPIDVTVSEGTSMSVAVSPHGQTLALDLQGSIWTLPATGGAATRITDVFNDAR